MIDWIMTENNQNYVVVTPTEQVSLKVVRRSDGQAINFVFHEKTHVEHLKDQLRMKLAPQFKKGCRLVFREKVLKGKHSLKHYGIKKGVNDQAICSKKPMNIHQTCELKIFFLIVVDDSKDWKSSSSDSDSEYEHDWFYVVLCFSLICSIFVRDRNRSQ